MSKKLGEPHHEHEDQLLFLPRYECSGKCMELGVRTLCVSIPFFCVRLVVLTLGKTFFSEGFCPFMSKIRD